MQKTLTRTIGEGTFWVTLNNVLLKIIWLATTFFVLRELTVYSYGLATLVLSIVPILSIFILSSLDKVVIADMGVLKSRNRSGSAKELLKNYLFIQFILGIFVWAVIFFGSDIISTFYNEGIGLLFKIISFSFLITPIRTSLNVVFSVNFNFLAQSAYSFTEEALKFTIILISLFVFKLGVVSLILAHTMAPFISTAVFLPVFIKSVKSFKSQDEESNNKFNVWFLIKTHGKWSLFSSYLGQLDGKIRPWILQFLVGTEVVGLFTVAKGLFSHVASLIPLNKVITPIIAQYSDDKRRFLGIVNKVVKYQLLVFTLIVAVGYFLFPPIIVWLFPNYEASMILFKIMIFALIPSSFGRVFWPVFLALQEQKKWFFIHLSKLISTIFLLPLFVYLLGFIGIAYEFLISIIIFVTIRYFIMRKILPDFKFSLKSFLTIDSNDYIIAGKIINNLKKTVLGFRH